MNGTMEGVPQAQPLISAIEKREPRLLDRARAALRVRHMSLRTEKTYVHWIRRFILFHQKKHPKDMAEAEINAFLTHLAVEGRVSIKGLSAICTARPRLGGHRRPAGLQIDP